MRYSTEHKLETRTRVLYAAGELFRQEGYGGSGIDALTKAAGVTNGAFYGHFKSKSEAFRAAVQSGLDELRLGISTLKAQKGKGWLPAFVSYYLGPKRTCALGQSCALPSLSPDVMRADADTKVAYEVELRRVIEEAASGLTGNSAEEREENAIALLALLSGGVTMARAVSDPALSARIVEALERKVGSIASSTEER
ncbi:MULTISPECIES: TetR/AcrR family transcriptional regulator [unclassified Rhizobium]|uniref:TetR/AcrR family transcriptional regulator n=1 Tax=unclassified Rhizobium TaxID=2613769 RepID=UPI000CDF4ABA|nr:MULTISPECIES: TetR/AcrR family transcriptional regulator [Rhizobium]AVA20422.1 TetR family transcriptional regulator protein [Rhizobium sp. NXC24]MDK4742073.1 TetR/AcrR family transcriptional regulator [Rhizobium sp. CNPSo 3464]UWU21711.1 TetR/AcrR family transcriptional regulator [Rhizobium tropici]